MSQSLESIPFQQQAEFTAEPSVGNNEVISSSVSQEPKISGIASIGINPTGLVFQIINFIILFLVLRKFLFKPISTVLSKRVEAIEKSLKDAKDIEDQKSNWVTERKKLENEAIKKSDEIINNAKKTAEKIKHEISNSAKDEYDKMIKKAKIEIESLKDKSLQDARSQLLDLVALLSSKVTMKLIDTEKDIEIINKTIKEVK